jgi:hypothetical protein
MLLNSGEQSMNMWEEEMDILPRLGPEDEEEGWFEEDEEDEDWDYLEEDEEFEDYEDWEEDEDEDWEDYDEDWEEDEDEDY